jgi:hypothetical protein
MVQVYFYRAEASMTTRRLYETRTPHPPAVDDWVALGGALSGSSGRVVRRSWMYPWRGSQNWPPGREDPTGPPILHCELADVGAPPTIRVH